MDRLVRAATSDRQFVAGLGLVAVYAILRTLGAPDVLVLAWTGVAVLATLASPLSGLTVLAALGPFTEALTDDGRVTAVPYLLAALGVSIVLRAAFTWLRRPSACRPGPALRRPSVPIALALVIFAGTAIGVAVSALFHGLELGVFAAQMWVPGLGGALTVLFAATWLAARGEVRPLVVAVVSVSVGALLSVINELWSGALLETPIGWLLRADVDPNRLGGLFPAPNAVAALFVVFIVVCAGLAITHRSRAVRLAAVLAASVQLVALFLTLSRSGLLALGIAASLLAWRRYPRLGWLIGLALVIGSVAVLLLIWQIRGVPLVMEGDRLATWQAAVRMWFDNPLLGSGFRSFEWLHAEYGSPRLDAPHNEWLRLFAEEGTLIGLAGVAFAIVTPFVLLRSPNLMIAAIGAAAAGLFIAACFNNPFINVQVNVPAFLVVGVGIGLASRARSPALPDAGHVDEAAVTQRR